MQQNQVQWFLLMPVESVPELRLAELQLEVAKFELAKSELMSARGMMS